MTDPLSLFDEGGIEVIDNRMSRSSKYPSKLVTDNHHALSLGSVNVSSILGSAMKLVRDPEVIRSAKRILKRRLGILSVSRL